MITGQRWLPERRDRGEPATSGRDQPARALSGWAWDAARLSTRHRRIGHGGAHQRPLLRGARRRRGPSRAPATPPWLTNCLQPAPRGPRPGRAAPSLPRTRPGAERDRRVSPCGRHRPDAARPERAADVLASRKRWRSARLRRWRSDTASRRASNSSITAGNRIAEQRGCPIALSMTDADLVGGRATTRRDLWGVGGEHGTPPSNVDGDSLAIHSGQSRG